MKIRNMLRVLAALLALSALSTATNLKGTVKNGTTGKPAAGDDVVLLDMSQGMQEAARTKSDAQGRFSFNYQETGGPHMVRALHQGVNYFPKGGIIPPGTSTRRGDGVRRRRESPRHRPDRGHDARAVGRQQSCR